MQNQYDYLLDQKMVTKAGLKRAHQIARETNKSVEAILVVYFGINKKAIGRSFSTYYDCPFRIYDSNLPVSLAFLTGLKKSVLLNECWVPYRWGMDGIEVLVVDPWDFTKNNKIRVHLKATKIKFSVAIREDIEDFIHRLFNAKASFIVDT